MNTTYQHAIPSTDASAWHTARAGRWTGSMLGDLMTPPKSMDDEAVDAWGKTLDVEGPAYVETKSGPNAGQMRRAPGYVAKVKEAMDAAGIVLFGDTATTAIASKAAERLSTTAEVSLQTMSMTRGLELEPVARAILNAVWRPVDNCAFCPLPGAIPAGATPDGFVDNGEAVLDIKCPEKVGKLIDFATSVADDDFEALEAWDRGYAWQIMMEAKCAGVDHAWLVYFTDRIAAIRGIDGEDIQEWVNRECGGYLLEQGGVAFVARRFILTPERSKRIERVIAAAEIELDRMVKAMASETVGGWDGLVNGRGSLTAVEVLNEATESQPALQPNVNQNSTTVEASVPTLVGTSVEPANGSTFFEDEDEDEDGVKGGGNTIRKGEKAKVDPLTDEPQPDEHGFPGVSRANGAATVTNPAPEDERAANTKQAVVQTDSLTDRERVAMWVNDFIDAAPDVSSEVARHGIRRLNEYVQKWYDGIRKDL